MGVPRKPTNGKRKGSMKKTAKKTMWGGSPASTMLKNNMANPKNPGNYLDADIALLPGQNAKLATMTGGSLTSDAVMGAVNAPADAASNLDAYYSSMNLKGSNTKKFMTGGSAASNAVMKHVSLPSVLKPAAVESKVPSYMSLDPLLRPQNSMITGGSVGGANNQGPLQRQMAGAPAENLVFPDQEAAMERVQEVNVPVAAPARRPLMRPKGPSHSAKHQKTNIAASKHSGKRSKHSGKRSKKHPRRHHAAPVAVAPEAAAPVAVAPVAAAPVNNMPAVNSKKPMMGGASGFWSGLAGCGPVNVPNAGNTLSKFFTKSSSCPGPEFYANPPGLGSAGSGYDAELPSGAPFPFL